MRRHANVFCMRNFIFLVALQIIHHAAIENTALQSNFSIKLLAPIVNQYVLTQLPIHLTKIAMKDENV